MAPIGTLHVRPPLKMIVEGYGMVRRGENNAPCNKILRWSPRKILRARYALGHSHIAGRLYELRELRVSHVRLVYVEAVYIDAVNGTSIKGGFHADIIHVRRIVRSHRKFTTRNPNHPFWRSPWSGLAVLDRCLKSNRRRIDISGVLGNRLWTHRWRPNSLGGTHSERQVSTASSQCNQRDGRHNRNALTHSAFNKR